MPPRPTTPDEFAMNSSVAGSKEVDEDRFRPWNGEDPVSANPRLTKSNSPDQPAPCRVPRQLKIRGPHSSLEISIGTRAPTPQMDHPQDHRNTTKERNPQKHLAGLVNC
jgi:hypothetical protein